MKKYPIHLLISSSLFLMGCDQVQVSQSQVLQSSSQSQHQQAENLKATEQLKIQLAPQKRQITGEKMNIPAIQVKNNMLFQQQDQFTFDKYPIYKNNKQYYHKSELFMLSEIEETGIEWIDNLLYQEILENHQYFDKRIGIDKFKDLKKINDLKQQATENIKAYYQAYLTLAKQGLIDNYEYSEQLRYISQRENILTFAIYLNARQVDEFESGSEYIIIDTNKKSFIFLDDILIKENKNELKDLLWQEYQYFLFKRDGDISAEPYISKEEFYTSENFYFSEYGITFVYGPTEIGSYADGEMKFTINWDKLGKFIRPEYLAKPIRFEDH